MQFELVHINKFQYEIRFTENGTQVGRALMSDDGYFYVDLITRRGWWSPESLIQIGELVKTLNKEMDEHLKNYIRDNDDEDFNTDLNF